MKNKMLSLGCLLFSFCLIVIGLMQNQQVDVLNKAIKICLECIGIG